MTKPIEKLVTDLAALAAQHPDASLSIQLDNGRPHTLDPEVEPYFHQGRIIVPIVEDDTF